MAFDRSFISHTTIAAIALSTGAAAHAQFTIDPATNYPAAQRPAGIATGDFDADGDTDLATSTDTPDKINILLNAGNGNFAAGPVIAMPASSSPDSLIAADLDGDSDIDIAVVLRDLNQVRILLNNAGSFALASTTAIGSNAQRLTAADMDNDGDLDLALANRDSNSATVLANNGNATFIATTLATGAEPRGVAFGRFTASNLLGLAVSNHDDRTVSVFTQTAPGSFTLAGTLFVGAQDRPDGITAADLNNDGLDDLATASGDDTLALNRAIVFLATQTSSFTGPFAFATNGLNSSSIAAADLDCDAAMDLIVTNADGSSVSLLRNTGAGTFAAPQLLAADAHPDAIAATDLDADGDADLATSNRDSNSVSVFINQTCTQPQVPGDVNGDMIVGIDDLLAVVNSWGACPSPCPADVAPPGGDQLVNIDDLLTVINNWS